MLPAIYVDADVRCAAPFCPHRNRMGVSFDIAGQGTVYFAIDREHAAFLRLCLDDYIDHTKPAQAAIKTVATIRGV